MQVRLDRAEMAARYKAKIEPPHGLRTCFQVVVDYHTRYGQQWRQNAERVAWRTCKTWLESQLTLINLDQAKIEEVFLPYLVMPNNKTLFQIMQERQFLLPGGGEEPQPAG